MEKYAKTAINQTNKNSTQRTTIKSNKRKAIITTETNKEIPIRLSNDISTETLQTRREWQDILKLMKNKNVKPRLF